MEKSFETTLVTIIEVNPLGVPSVPDTATDGPKRKATRMSEGEVVQISRVKNMASSMEQSATDGDATSTIAFFLKASFKPFDDNFFELDPPVVGEGDAQKICWNAVLTDETGDLNVKVWDKACFSIFQMTASKVVEIWEDGVENEDQRVSILTTLNTNLTKEYQAYCSLKIWRKGTRTIQYKAEVHVNNVQSV